MKTLFVLAPTFQEGMQAATFWGLNYQKCVILDTVNPLYVTIPKLNEETETDEFLYIESDKYNEELLSVILEAVENHPRKFSVAHVHLS